MDKERDFFCEARPLGFILFARNVDNPEQLRTLTGDLRETLGHDCPILVDQEGGRVQRLRAPHWCQYDPFKTYGDMDDVVAAKAALRKDQTALAGELVAAGLNVNCTPVLDLPVPGAHDVIGDRAFSSNLAHVAALGEVVCDVMLEAGITPVLKHIPGHGRAKNDSHNELPTVDTVRAELEASDFEPFRLLSNVPRSRHYWGMTAHILYSALDAEQPCSISAPTIEDVIRGHIGFDGVLLSDDLFMDALAPYGDVPTRAGKCVQAGCDAVLHCFGAGDIPAMEACVKSVGKISEKAQKRLQSAAEFTKLAA